MKFIQCFLVFLLVMSCSLAGAEEQEVPATGTDLVRNCQFFSAVSNLPWGWEVLDVNQSVSICLAFMNKLIAQQKDSKEKKTFCLPDNVEDRQLAATFVTYAHKYPKLLTKNADTAAAEVLSKAYPCK